jgi:hypothetical protein
MIMLTVAVTVTNAQKNYSDIAANQLETILSEPFDNNSNNWITDNQWIAGKFVNGRYDIICKNFNKNTGLTYKTVSIDQSKDFEVETSFTVINGSGALVFGLSPRNFDHYRVEIDEKKNLLIVKNIPSKNKIEKIFSGKEENLVKDIGFYNKITVRKMQGIYYIFINDILINQIDNVTLDGDQIGFSVGLNSEITVDYLNVSYLKSKPSEPILAERNTTITKVDSSKILAQIAAKRDSLLAAKLRDSITRLQAQIKITPPPPPPSTPAIAWVSPSGATTILSSYNNTVRVKAKLNSSAEINSALFYVNGESKGEGIIVPVQDEPGAFTVEKTITLNAGENNVYLVATSVGGLSMKSDVRYFSNPLASMPEIRWGFPGPPKSMVSTETITLEVCIKSAADLLSANITIDGSQGPVARVFQRQNNDTCNYIWKPKISLKEGDNSIYVNAENAAGSNMSDNRIIKFSRAIAEKRLALVIGNSDYSNGTSLKNPKNDANLIEATLKNLGFTVVKQLNCRKDSMINAIKDFSRKLNDYNVALFYYAGHGVQVDNVNYLVPTDAKLDHKEDVSFDAIPVTMVTDQLKRNSANTNIVILDACRNNPYKAWARGGNEGFKAIGPVNGTIISFATSEGATASDGEGSNGLFTQELVKQMEIAQPIMNVFINTRKAVFTKTNGQQMPTEWNYLLTTDFSFKK